MGGPARLVTPPARLAQPVYARATERLRTDFAARAAAGGGVAKIEIDFAFRGLTLEVCARGCIFCTLG